MRLSRASFEFCTLMLLGMVLFAAAFLIFSRPRLPPYARVDAIEAQFAPQIERLREIALTATGTVTVAIVKQQERDRELFAVPGILSATAEFSRGGSREYGSGFDSQGTSYRIESKPAVDRPVLNEVTHWPRSGAKLEILEYVGIVRRPDGALREYRILFDQRELRCAWEAEGGAVEE